MLILFVFGHMVFGVSLGGSVLTFVTLTLVVVFAMTGFSLLVAAFARTREQIIPIGLTVVMLVCAIGGCWWPLFMEPRWLQRIAHATPTAWAMDGLSDLILRDRTLGEIGLTLAALLAYGLVCLGAGARLYRLADCAGHATRDTSEARARASCYRPAMKGRSDELAAMLRAADAAAQLLRDQFTRPEQVRVDEKAAGDFVSSADLRSQEIIRGVLSGAFPTYLQLLEEGHGDRDAPSGAPRFIVDPLDGTTNFLHGIPHFAVSIALEKEGELAAGVVHDVVKGEIFSCEKGKGAWLGTRPLHGSPARALSRSVVGTGIPHHGSPNHGPYPP